MSLLLAGCGAVGEPLYPAVNIPMRVDDLVAVERGDKIDIRFTISPKTTEGLLLKQIGNLDLRIGPGAAEGAFQVDQWAASARSIPAPTPDAPGPVHIETPARDFVGKEVIVALRIANARGKLSDWSNLVIIPIEPPLPTPADFHAQAVAEGVRLTWTTPRPGSFRIFRQTADEQQPSQLATSDRPEYLDTTTEYGKTYTYFVEAIHDKTESEVAGPTSITPKDTFPPRVPTGLVASAGLNAVELAWERNTESDFKEYRVYRAEGDGSFTQIAEGLEGPSYSDRKVESGKRYRYRITAADQSGNESVPSPVVEITAP